MFDVVSQVLLAVIRTIFQSAINIFLYSVLSRIFRRWLGFNLLISFICSNYCISKILGFIQYIRLTIRLKRKQSEEKILFDELSWISANTNDQLEFETDWKFLLDNDRKTILSSIVDVPFQNGWLFLTIIIIIDYQINNSDDSYIGSVCRTIAFIIILISGAAVRYQTLFERDRKKSLDLMLNNDKEFERFIVYSKNTIPIASVGLQVNESSENMILIMKLYQLNSKFNDYFYDIANYICQNLIEEMKSLAEGNRKSIRLIWSFPTCKKSWKYAIKANKFVLNKTYQDFSFMPFVHSYVEQYEYQESISSDIVIDDTKKSQ